MSEVILSFEVYNLVVRHSVVVRLERYEVVFLVVLSFFEQIIGDAVRTVIENESPQLLEYLA